MKNGIRYHSYRKWFIRAVLFLCVAFFIYIVSSAILYSRYNAKDVRCTGLLFQLKFQLCEYHDMNHTFPDFADQNGRPTWSWRAAMLPYFAPNDYKKIRLDEPWNSVHNLPVVKIIDPRVEESMACPFLFWHNKHAAYVAVTGEGTAWTEINKGTVTLEECEDMILLIETENPRNHWAEPGDDMSPEEVIAIFEAYKKRKETYFPPARHPAKCLGTAGRRAMSFDDFKDVEELKKHLIISPRDPLQKNRNEESPKYD